MYAPIALFVYNRPWHTQQTIEALQRNKLAAESQLVVFSDGPKSPETALAVQEVRDYLSSITGFKSVRIIVREKNLGLANSIISGVTQICNEYGQIIVLEDDLVTSPYFLQFMNDSLNLYQHEEKVISIHGYTYPVTKKLPETFFLRGADCWGWATWSRGWKMFDPNGKNLIGRLKSERLEREFNFDGGYDYLAMLDSQVRGKNDSWAIRWYASAFLNNKLTLYPGKSLVLNIGNDGSGTHCSATEIYSGDLIGRQILVGNIQIKENSQVRLFIAQYFKKNKDSFLHQMLLRVMKIVKRWVRCGS